MGSFISNKSNTVQIIHYILWKNTSHIFNSCFKIFSSYVLIYTNSFKKTSYAYSTKYNKFIIKSTEYLSINCSKLFRQLLKIFV